MKNLIFLILIFAGCKTIYMPQKKHDFYIPINDSIYNVFDIERFEKGKTRTRNIVDTKTGTIDQTSSMQSYQERVYFKNSPFAILRKYYTTGKLRYKGVYFTQGSIGIAKGIWYDYDREGRLIKTIDYDKGYAFTWEDVLNYCVTNNIPITLGYQPTSTYDTSIKKMYSKEFKRNVWKIIYPDTTGVGIGQGFPMEVKVLDGNSGKVLATQKGGVLEPCEN